MNNLLPSDFLKITNSNSDQDRYNTRNGGSHFCVNIKWGAMAGLAPPESALVLKPPEKVQFLL